MRRSDREIKDIEGIIQVMEKCDVCRLAFYDGGYPYILPLNFGMQVHEDQITLYFHGADEGKKYELMEKDAGEASLGAGGVIFLPYLLQS